jgi:hypothetical protein
MFDFITLSGEVDLGDIASVLVLLPTAVGLILTWRQLRQHDATQKAIFVRDLYSTLFADQEMLAAIPLLESGEISFEHGSDFFNSPTEASVNKLLAHCELISTLYLRGALSNEDMDHFEYNLRRILSNPNVISYFKVIDAWCKHHGFDPRRGPFGKFREYGRRLGYPTLEKPS